MAILYIAIERMEERKREEELKQLRQEEGSAGPPCSAADLRFGNHTAVVADGGNVRGFK